MKNHYHIHPQVTKYKGVSSQPTYIEDHFLVTLRIQGAVLFRIFVILEVLDYFLLTKYTVL